MILSIKELHRGLKGHGEDELIFYNYIVCRVDCGRKGNNGKYDVYAISNTGVSNRIACECDLEFCRELIAEAEPGGTKVTQLQKAKKTKKPDWDEKQHVDWSLFK
jgi:hypothetical protein